MSKVPFFLSSSSMLSQSLHTAVESDEEPDDASATICSVAYNPRQTQLSVSSERVPGKIEVCGSKVEQVYAVIEGPNFDKFDDGEHAHTPTVILRFRAPPVKNVAVGATLLVPLVLARTGAVPDTAADEPLPDVEDDSDSARARAQRWGGGAGGRAEWSKERQNPSLEGIPRWTRRPSCKHAGESDVAEELLEGRRMATEPTRLIRGFIHSRSLGALREDGCLGGDARVSPVGHFNLIEGGWGGQGGNAGDRGERGEIGHAPEFPELLCPINKKTRLRVSNLRLENTVLAKMKFEIFSEATQCTPPGPRIRDGGRAFPRIR
ncbi:hypothetical protein C8R45DRAFT_1083216 [Mycena sanguinolenta]|nr:hypothetical protein C8R45DRAFT_1083216 [Mycena sanguinolenta]